MVVHHPAFRRPRQEDLEFKVIVLIKTKHNTHSKHNSFVGPQVSILSLEVRQNCLTQAGYGVQVYNSSTQKERFHV